MRKDRLEPAVLICALLSLVDTIHAFLRTLLYALGGVRWQYNGVIFFRFVSAGTGTGIIRGLEASLRLPSRIHLLFKDAATLAWSFHMALKERASYFRLVLRDDFEILGHARLHSLKSCLISLRLHSASCGVDDTQMILKQAMQHHIVFVAFHLLENAQSPRRDCG